MNESCSCSTSLPALGVASPFNVSLLLYSFQDKAGNPCFSTQDPSWLCVYPSLLISSLPCLHKCTELAVKTVLWMCNSYGPATEPFNKPLCTLLFLHTSVCAPPTSIPDFLNLHLDDEVPELCWKPRPGITRTRFGLASDINSPMTKSKLLIALLCSHSQFFLQ